MATSNYDTEKLSAALTNIARLKEKVSSLCDDFSTLSSLDNRIKDYYNEKNNYFTNLEAVRKALNSDIDNVSEVSSWLDSTILSLGLVLAHVGEISTEDNQQEINTEIDTGGEKTTGLEETTERVISTEIDTGGEKTTGLETTTENVISTEIDTTGEKTTGLEETTERVIDTEVEKTSENPREIDPVPPTGPGNEFEGLTPAQQATVLDLLKKAGFTDDEIAKILGGAFGIPQGVLDKLKDLLEKLYKNDPSIRDYFIKKFGIEIFNDDGTVNQYLLSLLLLLDLYDNSYDLFTILKEKYGIEVPLLKNLDALIKALEKAVIDNPKLRQAIIDKYGFDIFNDDGTINLAMLKLLLLIDALNNDPHGILDLILEYVDANTFILNNLDAFSVLLLELLKMNPDLALYLKEKYGIDIFNKDGTVNLDNLKLALILDAVNGDTDLLQLLKDKYGIDVPSAEDVDALALLLIKLLQDDPELRQYLIDKYGFDIFNEDGTINIDKLRIALTIDNLSLKDTYDLINLLADRYGLDVPTMNELEDLAKLLMDLYAKDPSIRDYLLKRYGFDIFNADGSINLNKLLVALFMDQLYGGDFNLLDFLNGLNNNPGIIIPEPEPLIDTVNNPIVNPVNTPRIDNPNSPSKPIDDTNISTLSATDGSEIDVSNLGEYEEPIINDLILDEPIIDDSMTDAYTDVLIEDDEKKTKSSKKKSNIWGALAGVGLILGATSLGAYKIIKDKKDDEDDDDYGYEEDN